MTQGAVSRQIATLEAYLGFSLNFQRHARGLALTPQGQQYLPEVKTAFDLLLSATQKACRENAVIRLKAPTCAMRWLVPQLMKLETEHLKFMCHSPPPQHMLSISKPKILMPRLCSRTAIA